MSSAEKGEVKVGAANELGCRFDDMLESLMKEGHQWEGAIAALRKAESAAVALSAHVDKEVDEGKLDLEQSKLVKLWLGRAAQATHNLFLNAQNQVLVTQGKVNGLTSVVALTKKYRDEEEMKVRVAVAQVESHKREPEGRPGPTIKEQRLAEEASKKPVKKRAKRK